MNKKELLNLIKTLKIDKSEFWVLSSGNLVLRDLLDNANDLDIAVTEKGLEQLKLQFNLVQKDTGFYYVNDLVECIVKPKDSIMYDKIGDLQLQNLVVYHKWLSTTKREKDKIKYEIVTKYLSDINSNDIKSINEYIKYENKNK